MRFEMTRKTEPDNLQRLSVVWMVGLGFAFLVTLRAFVRSLKKAAVKGRADNHLRKAIEGALLRVARVLGQNHFAIVESPSLDRFPFLGPLFFGPVTSPLPTIGVRIISVLRSPFAMTLRDFFSLERVAQSGAKQDFVSVL